ncbi:MAG: alpha/beta hydrolase [Verrucomicrobiaceae bacterium]|nr:alpha/beta hydrolase [Verrucomicrobiaceae bacterium]
MNSLLLRLQSSAFRPASLFVPMLCMTAFCATAGAQTTGKQPPQKKPAVKLTDMAPRVTDIVFKKTPQGDLSLHICSPADAKPADRRPAIVFFFGGGWKNGNYTQFVPQAEYFASRGLVCACADYRIASIHKTTPDKCVEDAKSAMRWMRGHAAELGVNSGKVIASGGSAGGHLAAATWLVPGFEAAEDDKSISCKPDALVLFNPALNLTNIGGAEIPDANGRNIAKEISPTLFLTKEAPPAILFFGTADKLGEHGREYVTKAKELGVHAELWTADGMGHGFFNRSPWTEVTVRKADEFLASLGYVTGEPTLKLPEGAPSLKQD